MTSSAIRGEDAQRTVEAQVFVGRAVHLGNQVVGAAARGRVRLMQRATTVSSQDCKAAKMGTELHRTAFPLDATGTPMDAIGVLMDAVGVTVTQLPSSG